MLLKYHTISNKITIAELVDDSFIINQPQDVLDIFGNLMAEDCERIILNEKNLHSDFFDLKTRLAGEVLQKFSNYRVKVAIVGDFSRYKSKSLHNFILESNKSNYVFFAHTVDSALQRLGS